MAAPRVMYLLHRSRLFLMTANSSLADLSTRVPARSQVASQALDMSASVPGRHTLKLVSQRICMKQFHEVGGPQSNVH